MALNSLTQLITLDDDDIGVLDPFSSATADILSSETFEHVITVRR